MFGLIRQSKFDKLQEKYLTQQSRISYFESAEKTYQDSQRIIGELRSDLAKAKNELRFIRLANQLPHYQIKHHICNFIIYF